MRRPFALRSGLGGDQRVAEKAHELLTALVAHDQPLLAFAAHIADRQITEGIRVVDAGAAGEGKEIPRQLGNRQREKRDQPLPAIIKAQLDPEIGAELEIGDRLRRGIQQLEEVVEILRGRIIGAGRADDVELLEAELGFQRAQGVYLAGNADQRDPLEPARGHLFHQGDER